jgi:hypothetical protein
LPFLFDLKAQEVKNRYDVVLWSEDKKGYLVKVLPKYPEEQERYSIALIYLDRNFLLPTQIRLIMPDRKSTQDFHLSHIEPNKTPVNPQFFEVVNPKKPWKVIRNPGGDGPADPANAGASKRKPAGKQAAQRRLRPDEAAPR